MLDITALIHERSQGTPGPQIEKKLTGIFLDGQLFIDPTCGGCSFHTQFLPSQSLIIFFDPINHLLNFIIPSKPETNGLDDE